MRGLRLHQICFLLLLCTSFVWHVLQSPQHSYAAVPSSMSFQGKLTNPDGTNVPDGAYSVRFRMYTDAVADAANPCGSNSCVWEETHGSVPVEGGIFHVSLGSLSSLSSVDFSTPPLYLAMKVGSDNEMTPRINLESSPFAINSDQLDGLDSGQFAQLGQGIQVDSSASTPSIGINKTGSGALAQLQHNGTTAFILQNNG